MDMDYRPKKNINKNNKNKNSDDDVEFDEYSQCDSYQMFGKEKCDSDYIYDCDNDCDSDISLNVNDYITQFDSKYPSDYPEYEDRNVKFVKKIVKIKSLYMHLELKWKPLFYLQKVKEEKKIEDAKKEADKAFAVKSRCRRIKIGCNHGIYSNRDKSNTAITT